MARWFEEQGFSWAYWEFSAGFGIYAPSTQQYNTKLVDAFIRSSQEISIAFAHQEDLATLYQLHRFIVADVANIAPDDVPELYPVGTTESAFREGWLKGIEKQVSRRVMRRVGDAFYPTIYGAFRMTWRQLWPFKQWYESQRDQRADEILQQFRAKQG